jgi:hypothetical protein
MRIIRDLDELTAEIEHQKAAAEATAQRAQEQLDRLDPRKRRPSGVTKTSLRRRITLAEGQVFAYQACLDAIQALRAVHALPGAEQATFTPQFEEDA